MSSTDSNEKHMLHTKSNNIEVTINNFIQELFDLLLDRYQEGMEQSFIVRKGVPAPHFLRHPPLDPACHPP